MVDGLPSVTSLNSSSSWLDRIPFVLLFGIVTSSELFETSLPQSTASLIQGRCFEMHDVGGSIDRIYESFQTDPDVKLWLGHRPSSFLFQKSRDYFQSPEGFACQVKVCFSGHTCECLLKSVVRIYVAFLRKFIECTSFR
jgi:origin recognition complex subunit 3